eukprot:CAMPEP_0197716564 /NCGR_PEP_ID=MMETSP1434-20131217/1414_1 /TAXON_ID=265543 /ORGANISM="Minutocellus polymorphus, Strain CCMP3303" /LENGTH=70 /DNA_ID=CAMNT_0043300945 /DNA_START=188 /DNA_END=397 /DNA_ORIENTATION=+
MTSLHLDSSHIHDGRNLARCRDRRDRSIRDRPCRDDLRASPPGDLLRGKGCGSGGGNEEGSSTWSESGPD